MGKRQTDGHQSGGIMLRKGHWYARIVVKGRQKWRSAPTKEAAQLLLGRMREDAARERVDLPKVQRDTLADFAPRYMTWAKTRKDSWARDEMSLRNLTGALGHFRLSELTIARVEAYMRDRRQVETVSSVRAREAFARARKARKVAPTATAPAAKMLSPATVNREVACLRGLLSYAVKVGDLERNPIAGIVLFREAPGRMPTLEPEDEGRLIAALPPWMQTMFRLAVLTGCRQGEIIALRWRHVDFDHSILTVEDSKSGEARRVPLHPSLAAELRARRGTADGWVIPMPGDAGRIDRKTGKALPPIRDAHTVSQAFRRAARRIGRPDLRWHDTRHLAGSRLLATGASLPEVAATLGHKTLAMSKRYTHVSPVRLASLIATMPAPAEAAPAPAKTAPRRVKA